MVLTENTHRLGMDVGSCLACVKIWVQSPAPENTTNQTQIDHILKSILLWPLRCYDHNTEQKMVASIKEATVYHYAEE